MVAGTGNQPHVTELVESWMHRGPADPCGWLLAEDFLNGSVTGAFKTTWDRPAPAPVPLGPRWSRPAHGLSQQTPPSDPIPCSSEAPQLLTPACAELWVGTCHFSWSGSHCHLPAGPLDIPRTLLFVSDQEAAHSLLLGSESAGYRAPQHLVW